MELEMVVLVKLEVPLELPKYQNKTFELIDELGLTKPTYYRYKQQYESKHKNQTN